MKPHHSARGKVSANVPRALAAPVSRAAKKDKAMPANRTYVSITGLRLRHPAVAPVFWWHAVRAMRQARAAYGNLSVEARRLDGVHHTVSLWQTREAMLVYLRSGAHLRAMRVFPLIATGKVAGYAADRAPDWGNVPAILQAQGRAV